MSRFLLVVLLLIGSAAFAEKNDKSVNKAVLPICDQVKWEYEYHRFMLPDYDNGKGQFEAWLNKQGREGWELVSLNDKDRFGMFLTFKRPLCKLK